MHTDARPDFDPVRVVVADDSDDFASAVGEFLRGSGYTVDVAPDGIAALALVQRAKPHCVVFDVDMPGMDGLELAKHLRAEFADDVVLIAVSGHRSNEPAVRESFELADHYFEKPVDLEDLSRVLRPLA